MSGGCRSEWRTDFAVGSVWGLSAEYYKPLSAGSKWFIAPNIALGNAPFDLYDADTRVASYRLSNYNGGVDVGYAFNRFSELRMGYGAGYFGSKLSIGDPILPTPSGRTGATSLRLEIDRPDSPVIPREGYGVRFRSQYNDAVPGSDRGFPLSEAYLAVVHPISPKGAAYLQTYGGTTYGRNDAGLPQFYLGDMGRLSAYGLNQLRGNQYFLGRLGYLHAIGKTPPLIGNKLYLTSAFEVGKMYGPQAAQSRLPLDGSVGFIAETFLGPIGIGGSLGDRGHPRWYFQIGRLF